MTVLTGDNSKRDGAVMKDILIFFSYNVCTFSNYRGAKRAIYLLKKVIKKKKLLKIDIGI